MHPARRSNGCRWRALETLPVTTNALANGELSFSAMRELARVATPSTEQAWCAHVGGMNLRQIEEAVSGRRPGDLPTDAPDPELTMHEITLRVTGGSCHDAHHRGALVISGNAPDQLAIARTGDAHARGVKADERNRAHVGATAATTSATPTRFEQVALRTQARDALVGLGWKPAIASSAVDEARAAGHANAPLEQLIREALRRCPVPRA